jgi:hypothetical protein
MSTSRGGSDGEWVVFGLVNDVNFITDSSTNDDQRGEWMSVNANRNVIISELRNNDSRVEHHLSTDTRVSNDLESLWYDIRSLGVEVTSGLYVPCTLGG